MRFKLLLEYDGSRYAGWQLQRNDRSVQGELLDAVSKVFETDQAEVYGAGRTDAGVHARGQVAHMEVPPTKLPMEQIMMRLNDILPHDINILRVQPVGPRFHARHDARSRSYTYHISKRRDAFGKKYLWWVRDRLQVADMRAAAAHFVGFHDFRSFGEVEKPDQSTLVDIDRVDIQEDAERILIHITGSHFLGKMVRRMVGVLVEVGRGKLSPQTVEEWMKSNSREPARFTAPPSGLFLEHVGY